jgi:hypothetical protein
MYSEEPIMKTTTLLAVISAFAFECLLNMAQLRVLRIDLDGQEA